MKEFLCKQCVWVNSQPNENGMVHCKLLDRNVYGGSMPCPDGELYEPPFR